jgi:hypothetical protein
MLSHAMREGVVLFRTYHLTDPVCRCLFIQLRTAALRLIVRSWLDFQVFATRRLHAFHHARAPSGRRWNCGREMSGNLSTLHLGILHSHLKYTATDEFQLGCCERGNELFGSTKRGEFLGELCKRIVSRNIILLAAGCVFQTAIYLHMTLSVSHVVGVS